MGSFKARAISATGVGVALRPRPLRGSGWETTSPTSWSEEMRPRRMVAAKSGVPAKATFKARGASCGPFDFDLDLRYREASLERMLGGIGGLLDHRVDEHEPLFLDGCDEDTLEAAYLVGGEPDPLVIAHGEKHLLRQVRERSVEALDRRGAGLENRVSEHPDLECHALFIPPRGLHRRAPSSHKSPPPNGRPGSRRGLRPSAARTGATPAMQGTVRRPREGPEPTSRPQAQG